MPMITAQVDEKLGEKKFKGTKLHQSKPVLWRVQARDRYRQFYRWQQSKVEKCTDSTLVSEFKTQVGF